MGNRHPSPLRSTASNSGALPLKPRDLSLCANGMVLMTEKTLAKWSGPPVESRQALAAGQHDHARGPACLPFHATGIKRKISGVWGQSPHGSTDLVLTSVCSLFVRRFSRERLRLPPWRLPAGMAGRHDPLGSPAQTGADLRGRRKRVDPLDRATRLVPGICWKPQERKTHLGTWRQSPVQRSERSQCLGGVPICLSCCWRKAQNVRGSGTASPALGRMRCPGFRRSEDV
jgi:hypothetical protein